MYCAAHVEICRKIAHHPRTAGNAATLAGCSQDAPKCGDPVPDRFDGCRRNIEPPNCQTAASQPPDGPSLAPTLRHARAGGLGRNPERTGPTPRIGPEKVEKIVHTTLHTQPKGATHWSCRTMAQHCGLSPATVQRIWMPTGYNLIGSVSSSCRAIRSLSRN